jgi:hypothetical protein
VPKPNGVILPAIGIDFDWVQFPSYELRVAQAHSRSTIADGTEVGARLIARGRPLRSRPLDQFPGLYLQLAAAVPTVAGHQAFAQKFGLLTDRRSETQFSWMRSVESMRNLVELASSKEKWKIKDENYVPYQIDGGFNFRFEPGPSGDEMKLSVVPINLYSALVFQCISHRSSGAKTRVCKVCHTLFEVGGTSGRRSHAEFCSDSCRYQFNHRNRSKKQ